MVCVSDVRVLCSQTLPDDERWEGIVTVVASSSPADGSVVRLWQKLAAPRSGGYPYEALRCELVRAAERHLEGVLGGLSIGSKTRRQIAQLILDETEAAVAAYEPVARHLQLLVEGERRALAELGEPRPPLDDAHHVAEELRMLAAGLTSGVRVLKARLADEQAARAASDADRRALTDQLATLAASIGERNAEVAALRGEWSGVHSHILTFHTELLDWHTTYHKHVMKLREEVRTMQAASDKLLTTTSVTCAQNDEIYQQTEELCSLLAEPGAGTATPRPPAAARRPSLTRGRSIDGTPPNGAGGRRRSSTLLSARLDPSAE